MSGYVKTFDDNKLMTFCIDNDKLKGKYKTIWTKTKELKGVELSALSVYDEEYIKTKIRTHGNKVYTDFHDLGMPEDGVECDCILIVSIDFLFMVRNISEYI